MLVIRALLRVHVHIMYLFPGVLIGAGLLFLAYKIFTMENYDIQIAPDPNEARPKCPPEEKPKIRQWPCPQSPGPCKTKGGDPCQPCS